jgi:hypothetical protein
MNSLNLFIESFIVKQSRNYTTSTGTSEYQSAFILPVSEGGKVFFSETLNRKWQESQFKTHNFHKKGNSMQLPSKYHPPRLFAKSYTKQ